MTTHGKSIAAAWLLKNFVVGAAGLDGDVRRDVLAARDHDLK